MFKHHQYQVAYALCRHVWRNCAIKNNGQTNNFWDISIFLNHFTYNQIKDLVRKIHRTTFIYFFYFKKYFQKMYILYLRLFFFLSFFYLFFFFLRFFFNFIDLECNAYRKRQIVHFLYEELFAWNFNQKSVYTSTLFLRIIMGFPKAMQYE